MRSNFHQFSQKWPFSDKKVNKRYFLKPKLCQKSLKSVFLQRTSVSHIFYAKSNVYKSITISFKRIYECILRFVSLILIRKVWLQTWFVLLDLVLASNVRVKSIWTHSGLTWWAWWTFLLYKSSCMHQ